MLVLNSKLFYYADAPSTTTTPTALHSCDKGLEEALRLGGVLERADPMEQCAAAPSDLRLEPREALEGRLALRRGVVA